MLMSYFIIAIVYTWAFHLSIVRRELPYDARAARKLYWLGLPGPLVAALIVSATMGAGGGLPGLLAGVLRWRVGLRWWLLALLPVLVVYVVGTFVYWLRNGRAPRKLFHAPTQGWTKLALGQLYVVVSEEIGWRGLALPLLIAKFGSLGGTLVLGVGWALWHLPMFWVKGSNQQGSFLTYTFEILLWSIVMSAVYVGSGGSILLCMLFHAATNTWYYVMDIPREAVADINLLTLIVALLSIMLLPPPLLAFNF
jgi:membrane protease YdiL (CAAX protease family)